MKKLGLLLGILFIGFTATAQDAEGVTITVIIENVLNENGQILAGLHTEETFMKGQGLDNYMGEASKGEVSFTFKNVKPGMYAISVMHDENGNMAMDFEDNGMPKESYGMSGSAMSMGPPTFADSKFEVADKDMELKIRF